MTVTAKELGLGIAATKLLKAMGTAAMVNAAEVCRLIMPLEYAGSPDDNVVPDFEGQLCTDLTNHDTYFAFGTTAADWEKLSG